MYALFQQIHVELHANAHSFDTVENLNKNMIDASAEVEKYSPAASLQGRSSQSSGVVQISSAANS